MAKAEAAAAPQQTEPGADPGWEPVARAAPAAITEARFRSSEYERTIWVINADEGTEPRDLENPDYYAHVASKLKPYDRLEVRANDGTWYAELLVVDVSRQWARAKMLMWVNLTTMDMSQTAALAASRSPYFIKFLGPQDKWCVIRRVDAAIVSQGNAKPEDASRWMSDRLQAG